MLGHENGITKRSGMKTGQFSGELVSKILQGGRHNGALGTRFVGNGEDWVELAIDYDTRFVADAETGIMASGPILSLMDMATSMAVWAKRDFWAPVVTLDLRIDYLRPAIPGRTLYGRGICYRLTRRIAFVHGETHDGDRDDLVAHTTGAFMLLESQ